MAHVPFDRRQQGFTIIELMIAVAIVGALAGLAIPNYLGFLDKARVARAIAEVRYIERVIDSYEAAYDALPNSLAQAGAGEMVDPWGNPYEYLNIAALTLPGGGGGGGGNGGG
ncbi:MAG: prepilin-type N-terminal cleavage/methylation domain-containing protein, partial [Nitrospira sp. CR1.2]|nr:prepilin-type N-terminal cleavage/methylation domain-containing protein [Nitrospira sp. CR1.2]